jgi:hypothetical protein
MLRIYEFIDKFIYKNKFRVSPRILKIFVKSFTMFNRAKVIVVWAVFKLSQVLFSWGLWEDSCTKINLATG